MTINRFRQIFTETNLTDIEIEKQISQDRLFIRNFIKQVLEGNLTLPNGYDNN